MLAAEPVPSTSNTPRPRVGDAIVRHLRSGCSRSEVIARASAETGVRILDNGTVAFWAFKAGIPAPD